MIIDLAPVSTSIKFKGGEAGLSSYGEYFVYHTIIILQQALHVKEKILSCDEAYLP